MIIRRLISILLGIFMYFYDFRLIMEWLVFRVNSLNLEFYVLLDWVSLIFMGLVILISSVIFLYRVMYMRGDKFIDRFSILIFLFIISILFIIIRPNVFRILFGWDGLGLVSYCLIIYYQNYISYSSGIVTVLCNRIGDIGLLISIGLIIIYGRWGINLLSDKIVIIFLVLAAITKRAQIPFSSWLPMAMAAPTPVSALVHSSTLVTAGVYLMIRFNRLLMLMEFNFVLLFISIITLFISGLMANVEFDLKKIIALSTLRQLGIIIMILRLGFRIISFYHLLVHAVFKSMLFICAGIIIHLINNNQDIRNYGSLNEFIPFTIIRFYVSSISLCGFPFLAGFYSKDLIMEVIYLNRINLFLVILAVMSLILTVSYSFRLFYYVFLGEIKFIRFVHIKENIIINISMIILILLRMVVGSMYMWIFIRDFYIPLLSLKVKILTINMCVLGVILGLLVYFLITLNLYIFIYFIRRIWFLNYFIIVIYKPRLIFGNVMFMVDKIWVENSGRLIVLNYIIEYRKFKFMGFKIFMFINLAIFFVIIVYILIYLNSLIIKV